MGPDGRERGGSRVPEPRRRPSRDCPLLDFVSEEFGDAVNGETGTPVEFRPTLLSVFENGCPASAFFRACVTTFHFFLHQCVEPGCREGSGTGFPITRTDTPHSRCADRGSSMCAGDEHVCQLVLRRVRTGLGVQGHVVHIASPRPVGTRTIWRARVRQSSLHLHWLLLPLAVPRLTRSFP